MSGFTLTWRGGNGGSNVALVDGSFLRPDLLCALPMHELERRTIRIGRHTAALADLFTVTAMDEPGIVVCGAPALDRIGAGMTGGELLIEGDAGDDLGASMRGGIIRVRGDAGHRCGGPDLTSDRGMTGGTIVVHGRAGDHAGLRMRRGLVVAHGGAGASPGYRMLAGTLVIGAGELDHPGLEMRRGTIVSLDPASPLRTGVNFTAVGEFDLSAMPTLALIHAAVAQAGAQASEQAAAQSSVTSNAWPSARRYRLWTGDRFELGKGELWQAVS